MSDRHARLPVELSDHIGPAKSGILIASNAPAVAGLLLLAVMSRRV